MVNEVWLIRHGMRRDFENPGWRDTAERPHDTPLSEIGITQARETGKFMKDKGIKHIFSSPFRRAIETAGEIAKQLDLKVKVEYGFCEMMNPKWFDSFPDLQHSHGFDGEFGFIDEEYKSQIMPHYPEVDENIHTFERVGQALKLIISQYDGPVVIVGHGASVWQGGRNLVDPPSGMLVKMCALNKFVRVDSGWKLELATCDHLSFTEDKIKLI